MIVSIPFAFEISDTAVNNLPKFTNFAIYTTAIHALAKGEGDNVCAPTSNPEGIAATETVDFQISQIRAGNFQVNWEGVSGVLCTYTEDPQFQENIDIPESYFEYLNGMIRLFFIGATVNGNEISYEDEDGFRMVGYWDGEKFQITDFWINDERSHLILEPFAIQISNQTSVESYYSLDNTSNLF
jgi:hypothetical protein